MVHPLLNSTLHLDLGNPVDVVCRSLVVGRCFEPLVKLLVRDRLQTRGVEAINLQPLNKLVVIYVVLDKLLAGLVYEACNLILIRGVNLTTTLVYGAEHRLDTRCCLRHERRSTRRRDGEHGDVTTAILLHKLRELGSLSKDTLHHGVVLLLLVVVHTEGTTILSHIYRGTVGLYGEGLMYVYCEVDSLLRAVAQAESCEHIALCGDAETRTTAFECHIFNLVPQLQLYAAHILILGVRSNLVDDELHLLQLQVDDVIHEVHSLVYMRLEEVEVELRLLGEGLVDVAQQVESQQTAAIVGAQRNLATGVCRYCAEALVGIAVGHALANDCIPEQHTGLCRLPCVVDNLLPELLGIYILRYEGLLRADGELLTIGSTLNCCTHELVVNLDRYVGTRNLAGVDLGVDKTLGIGVLDEQREHQCATTTILCHLACRVRVTLHEGYDTC